MNLGSEREREDIRFVLPFPSIFYATVYLAHTRGFLAEEGLKSRIRYVARGTDPVAGLDDGLGDIAIGGVVRLMRLAPPDAERFAVIGQVNAANGFSILGRQTSFRWSDLIGRKFIPFSESQTPWLFTRSTLSREGVDLEQLCLVRAPDTDEAVKRFLSGEADFIEVPEPQVATLLHAGRAQLCASMAKLLGSMPFSVFIVRRDVLQSCGNRIARAMAAIRRAQEWLYRSPPALVAGSLHQSFPAVSIPILSMAISNYTRNMVWASDIGIQRQKFENMQDILVGGGERLRRLNFDSLVTSEPSIASSNAASN